MTIKRPTISRGIDSGVKTKKINMYITEDQGEKLKLAAYNTRSQTISESEHVRRALDEYFANHPDLLKQAQ
jgi:hypothetical protein